MQEMEGKSLAGKNLDVTLIGAGIIDVLAVPVGPSVFTLGSVPASQIRMAYGGDALNEAVTLSRLGKRASLLTVLGRDEAGAQVEGYLRENGVDTGSIIRREDLATGINLVLVDEKGERHFVTDPRGSLRALTEQMVMERIEEAAPLVSLASIFVSPFLDPPALERIFRRAKEKPGRRLSADFTTAKRGEKLEDLKGALSLLDVVFANEKEAGVLTGTGDPLENARRFLETGVGCVVIKTGSRGCILGSKEGLFQIPAYGPVRAIDTTGAGDSFAAGYLYGLLCGMEAVDCARFGSAVSSCCVESLGATGWPVKEETVRERFESLKAQPARILG